MTPPTLSRRAALTTLAVGTLAPLSLRGATEEAPACRDPRLIPNVVVTTDEGRRVWFLDDLLLESSSNASKGNAGRAVLIHFTSEAGERDYPVLAKLAQVVERLSVELTPTGRRLGEDVIVITVVTDPERSSPHALAELAQRHRPHRLPGVVRGWQFVSAPPRELELLKSRFYEHAHDGAHGSHATAPDCSRGLFRYGNAALGLWGSVPAKAEPEAIAERLTWVVPRGAAATTQPSRRRGPLPLLSKAAIALFFAMSLGLAARSGFAQGACTGKGHPYPQAQMIGQAQTTEGTTTFVTTGTSLFPKSLPFVDPPGTNLLPNVYTNNFDSNCDEIPNTLPSTPTVFYNLHDGEPVVSMIDRTSPTADLENLLDALDAMVADRSARDGAAIERARGALARGIDILEGNAIPSRTYSGFPLLHFDGPNKFKKVIPIYDANGKVVGGNVDVHQIWYDNHIESDTSLLDPTAVAEVPWTITYTLDVLDRGKDDFSPFVMYFDAPPGGKGAPFVSGKFGPFNVGMDQTFFPIEEGTRTVLKIKQAPAKYWSLVYTWGWRWHPPRIQVLENATKVVGGKTLLEWEQNVFGLDPRANQASKLAAIAKIGDLAPAKVMWNSFRASLAALDSYDPTKWQTVARQVREARLAFEDWKDRTRLPRGIQLDPTADMTLLYVNNTMYGQFTDGGSINFPKFQTRGAKFTVALKNGDYFDHAYLNVDFGGGRGWENQFKSSVKVGGSGCWFTFGRNYIADNLLSPVTIPAATPQKSGSADPAAVESLGEHRLEMTFGFDPSRRLRFYQFDPTHHDVAILSIH